MLRHFRYVVPAAAALAVVPLAPAAAQSISFGIVAGGSLSTFTGEFIGDVKNYATFVAGAFARLEAMGFAVQPGLFYASKGTKAEDPSTAETSKTTVNYLQIPLVLRLGMGTGKMRLYVGAGPSVGIKIGCKFRPATAASGDDSNCEDTQELDPVKSTEVSGIVEAGLEFGKFSIGARGDLGLTNVFESVQAGSADNLGVKTRTISAVAAIRF